MAGGIWNVQATAVVRIRFNAAWSALVTSWLVSMMTAVPVPPPLASASRFGPAVAASSGPKTPMTKVGTAGVPAAPPAASAAMAGMSSGVHSVGRPSVTSTTATLWSGTAIARARAACTGPDRAGPVGVRPSGWCAVSDVVKEAAAPVSAANGTAGVE